MSLWRPLRRSNPINSLRQRRCSRLRALCSEQFPWKRQESERFSPWRSLVSRLEGCAMTNEVDFNPLDPRIVADPFPFYKPLMHGPPKQIFLGQTTTLIAQYDHVVRVLKDFDNFKNEIPQDEVNAALDVFGGAKVIPFADEPDHGRLRKLVRRTFSPQSVRTYT